MKQIKTKRKKSLKKANQKHHLPSFFFKTIHFREQHSQDTLALFPGKLGHVDFSLDPSPPLGFLQVIKHVVGAAVQLAESSHSREITLTSMRLEHALLISVLSVFSILYSIVKGMKR